MADSKLTPQQRAAAEMIGRGKTKADAAAAVGVNASSVSRWSKNLREFQTVVERERQRKLGKAAPEPAKPKSYENVDFRKQARLAGLAAWLRLSRQLNDPQQAADVKTSDITAVAKALASLAEDDDATSPEALANALMRDDETTSKVLEHVAADPAALQLLYEATEAKWLEGIGRDLGLDDVNVRRCFQHSEKILSRQAALEWHTRWKPVLRLLRFHADKIEATHRHAAVARQHGDEVDQRSIDHVHPVQVDELLDAAQRELERITSDEEADDAA